MRSAMRAKGRGLGSVPIRRTVRHPVAAVSDKPEVPPVEAPVVLAGRVAAAVTGGAPSWAAVGRAAGCSPTWARVLAGRAGLSLAGAGPVRDVRLSIRVRGSGAARLDAEAAAAGVTRSEMGRRLIAEALRSRDAEREGAGRTPVNPPHRG